MKTIKAIFWDLDGTLIDSEHIHNEAGFAALKQLNIAYKEVEIPAGMENKAAFTYLTDLNLEQAENLHLFKQWDDIIVDMVIAQITGKEAIPQSIKLVRYFNSLGIQQSVVSNSYTPIVKHSLKQIGILDLVSGIFPRDTVEFGKPHPQLYLNAMAHHQQIAEHCLTFEDSGTGIKAARAAKIDVVGIGSNTIVQQPNLFVDLNSNDWLNSLERHYIFDPR